MLILENFITICKYFVDTFIRPTKIDYEDIDECTDLEQGTNPENGLEQGTEQGTDQVTEQENGTDLEQNMEQDSDILTTFLREFSVNLYYSFRNIIYFGTKHLKYK